MGGVNSNKVRQSTSLVPGEPFLSIFVVVKLSTDVAVEAINRD